MDLVLLGSIAAFALVALAAVVLRIGINTFNRLVTLKARVELARSELEQLQATSNSSEQFTHKCVLYNETVAEFNNRIQRFPELFFAPALGYSRIEPVKLEQQSQETEPARRAA